MDPPLLNGYSFDPDLIDSYKKSRKLLSLRIETNYDCNLRCTYCYAPEVKKDKPFISFKEQLRVIDEAIGLGVKSVVGVGPGEPLLFPHLHELITYLHANDITFVTFTNLTLMTPDLARFLHDHNVSVIGKCDGPEHIQDLFSGKGSFRKMRAGLECLLEAGYADNDGKNLQLGLGATVCSVNYKFMPEIWRDMRRRNIFPNFERASIIGSASADMGISRRQVRELMNKLRQIDKDEFGIEWRSSYSPIPGHQCYLFYAGTHLSLYGGICPCPELPPVDDVTQRPLKEILHSDEYERIRNVDQHLEGKCKGCDELKYCHGCRSKAYICSSSVFAEDPFCSK